MLKQYKILVNEGKGSENVLVTVPAGAGARGNPTRITAKPDTRYELQDDLKGKGLAPDQVRGKRVGKNLYLMFEDNGKPDVIIEGYYDPINLQQVPTIVGKAENGSVYEYIPHDPELSSMSTTLKDGYTPAMLSLGGGPIAGGAFELAGLPLVAAAAGGGLGGLGLLAAGLGAAALGGGGGGGGGVAGGGDTTPPSKPTSLVIPENTNGGVSADEAKDGTTLEVGLPADAVVGDVLKTVVKKPDGTSFSLAPVVLTAAMIAAKTVTHTIPAADLKGDGVWTTSSTLTDAAGNVSTPIDGSFTLDTIAPTPTVSIDTDKSNDGTISSSEITSSATTVDVSATFTDKANLKVGDKVKFTDSVSGAIQEITLDPAMVAAGVVKTTFARPKDGVSLTVTAVLTDTVLNPAATSNTDTAVMGDTTAPTPVGGGLDCYLKHDTDTDRQTDNDTGASQTDSITQTRTPILVGKVEANASVSVLVDGHPYTTKADSNGDYAVSVTNALKDGPYTPVVTATDAFGNSKSTDGTPFYVDNLSDKNQKPTLDLPDTNTAAKVLIASISDDTRNSNDVNSTVTDFVTSDNTLIYKGTVEKFDNNGDYVKLELKDSKGNVIAIEYVKPDNLNWTWDRTGVTQADGKYTLDATIVDAAGNRVNMNAAGVATQVIYISNKSLQAVPDSDQDLTNSPGLVKAVEAGFNVLGSVGSGNVLANDKNDVLGYTGPQSNKTVKLIGNAKGVYGDIDLHADGTYTYTVDDNKQAVNSLGAGQLLSETFNYEVTDFSGATSTASLKVSVIGSNDQAAISITAPVPFTSAHLGQTFGIAVADVDVNEGKFLKLSLADQQGSYGQFTVSEINNEWSYQWNGPVSINGKNVHDLLVITSVDGSASGVIDVNLAGTGAITQQEYNTKTTNGLKVNGAGTFDILKITGQNQTLDLTKVFGGLTSQLNSIEEIDLGSSSNKLVLNLDDLTQADQQLLYVSSSGNSLVTFVNGTGIAVASSAPVVHGLNTYNVYHIDSTHDLLVQNTINQISFSAT